MNNAQVFFTTNHINGGALSTCGNACFAPLRYLFHGRDVQILSSNNKVQVHDVRSFHAQGESHTSRSNDSMRSAATSDLRFIIAVLTVIPGIFLGIILKGLSYLDASAEEAHRLIKEHFTPTNVILGSHIRPLCNKEIVERLGETRERGTKVWNLIIYHGKCSSEEHEKCSSEETECTITEDPGIAKLNPQKIILFNTRLERTSHIRDLDEKLRNSRKWLCAPNPTEHGTFTIQHEVASFLDVHQDILPKRPNSSKPYRAVYLVKE